MVRSDGAALTRLDGGDRARVEAISEQLLVAPIAPGEFGAAPPWLGDALWSLLDLSHYAAFRPARRSDGLWGLGERVDRSPDGFFDAYEEALPGMARPYHYDPLRPPREQRNCPAVRDEFCRHGPGECPATNVLSKFGIASHDQIRALVCDGPVVLGCVGGIREAPFTQRDKDVLAALMPPLQRNLVLRRKLLGAGLTRAGFDAALGWLDAPAFLVARNGKIAHANAVGAVRLDHDRTAVEARLRDAIAGTDHACEVGRLPSQGLGDVHLVVLREAEETFDQRVALALDRWSLTPREVDVLRMVAVGDSNKEISLRLACHEGTVERHVTSALRKAGCDSRARLVARFWTLR